MIKEFVPLTNIPLIQPTRETANSRIFLASTNESSLETDPDQLHITTHVERIKTPKELPILPIRGTVVFPGTVMPLGVGRPSSPQFVGRIIAQIQNHRSCHTTRRRRRNAHDQ